jgi:hypothetical protein
MKGRRDPLINYVDYPKSKEDMYPLIIENEFLEGVLEQSTYRNYPYQECG